MVGDSRLRRDLVNILGVVTRAHSLRLCFRIDLESRPSDSAQCIFYFLYHGCLPVVAGLDFQEAESWQEILQKNRE